MAERHVPNATSLMLMGLLSIVLGIIAIFTPAVAGQAVVMVIGGVLLVAGIVQVVSGLRSEGWSHKLPPLILGVITAAAGVGVLGHPLLGLTFLTLVLIVFFVVGGLWKIVASFSYRPARGWVAVLISGVLAIVLGILIWRQWPVSGLWAVGVLVGVDLLTTGIALVMLASTVRRMMSLAKNEVGS